MKYNVYSDSRVFGNVDAKLYFDDFRTYALTGNHNYALTNPCIPLSLMNPAII